MKRTAMTSDIVFLDKKAEMSRVMRAMVDIDPLLEAWEDRVNYPMISFVKPSSDLLVESLKQAAEPHRHIGWLLYFVPASTVPGPCVAPVLKEEEVVNHPSHYGGDTQFEVIKVLEVWLSREEFIGAMKFNIFKYNARAGKKNTEKEKRSYQKGCWYSNYLNDYLKRNPE